MTPHSATLHSGTGARNSAHSADAALSPSREAVA
jgi:hypothetical protein